MKILTILLLILLFGCNSKPSQIENASVNSDRNNLTDSLGFLTPKNMTLKEFLGIMKFKNQKNSGICSMTMQNDFPPSWLDSSDINDLITLVNSTEKYYCFKDPRSSYIPLDDSADLGGYAIMIIKAYKENRRVSFGLYSCPKANEKDVKELNEWWASQK